MGTRDQGFYILTTGQANWDVDENTNFGILEGGYRVAGQAGVAVSTGMALWMNSGGFFFPFNPASKSIMPMGLALTAQNSGDSMQALAWGIVRSLGINSPVVGGQRAFVSVLTPGVLVGSYSGADRAVGMGLDAFGSVLFQPKEVGVVEQLTSVVTIQAVTGSLHLFTMDGGKYGWNRYTQMIGNSANLVALKFYAEATRSFQLYATISGGVTTVGSFYDRAGWPYENADVNSYQGILYGTLMIQSAAAVGSDTIAISATWDRER